MKTLPPPNYKKIYTDMLILKHPEKIKYCKSILSKEKFTAKDVILINDIIFHQNNKISISQNQKHRSYDQSSILEILEYQKNNNLNNSQLAIHFKLSRNTITKWKKYFKILILFQCFSAFIIDF